ncbi:MAG: hypothetical protein ACLT0Y_03370 [Christensenellales bacterium]
MSAPQTLAITAFLTLFQPECGPVPSAWAARFFPVMIVLPLFFRAKCFLLSFWRGKARATMILRIIPFPFFTWLSYVLTPQDLFHSPYFPKCLFFTRAVFVSYACFIAQEFQNEPQPQFHPASMPFVYPADQLKQAERIVSFATIGAEYRAILFLRQVFCCGVMLFSSGLRPCEEKYFSPCGQVFLHKCQ